MFYELMEKVYELEASGKRIIKLNQGDTQLPAPQYAVEAARKFLRDKKATYVSSAGMPELRERIAARENCNVENVLVSSGSKILIYSLLHLLAGREDRIIFPAPYWPAYMEMSRVLGILPEVIDTRIENSWKFDDLPLEGAKALIVCNPLNPTSTIYPSECIEKTLLIAESLRIPFILDEAYRGIAFRQIPNYQCIRVRSFSKEFNMEGWRLAYVVAPKEIISALIRFNQITTTCTPPFIQAAGAACLDHEEQILSENRKIWKERVYTSISLLQKAEFRFSPPEAGMYIFASHEGIDNSFSFAMELLDRGVAVAPGEAFGEYPGFFRICLNQPMEQIEEAVEIMKQLLESRG